MKILVIGGNGQLGFELQRALALFGDVSITTRSSKCPAGYPCLHLDLNDADATSLLLNQLRPHLIVNAAAFTSVDLAETSGARAEAINRDAVAMLARKARELSAMLVHFSSDYVYSGENQIPWTERDPCEPQSVYGVSKLGGDQAVIDSECAHWILRTQWLYAARGNNFMRTMLRLGAAQLDGARAGEGAAPIQIVNDQMGAPTPVRWVAGTVASMISRWLQDLTMPGQSRTGLYHLSASGQTNWHEFAGEIFHQAYILGLLAEEPKTQGVSTKTFGSPAPRPRYAVLSNNKIAREFDIRLPDWRDGLAQTLAEYKLTIPLPERGPSKNRVFP
jgi:dTDP-4-dehydrorhamnose reductase